jgi:hypothetical protein
MLCAVSACCSADRRVLAYLLVGVLHPHGDVDGALCGRRGGPVHRPF